MTARQQLDSFIAKYSPEVASVARQAFRWMRKKFPRATVLVYDNYNALAIGFGPSERASDAVFSIAVFPRWTNLFFLQGAGRSAQAAEGQRQAGAQHSGGQLAVAKS